MDKSALSWQIKTAEESDFYAASDEYIGTYTRKNGIDVRIRLWNNRLGSEAVEDLDNFSIKIAFQDKEDSVLLQYLTVKYEEQILAMNSYSDYALIVFPTKISLSGSTNDGTSENRDNYVEFELLFQAPNDVRLKESDLKSLYLEVVPI